MCSGIGFYTQHANTDFFSSVYNCIYTRIFVQFICPEQGLATKQRALSASFKRVFTPLEVTVVTQQTSEMLSLQNVHCTLCSVPVRYFYNTVLIVETTQMEKRQRDRVKVTTLIHVNLHILTHCFFIVTLTINLILLCFTVSK